MTNRSKREVSQKTTFLNINWKEEVALRRAMLNSLKEKDMPSKMKNNKALKRNAPDTKVTESNSTRGKRRKCKEVVSNETRSSSRLSKASNNKLIEKQTTLKDSMKVVKKQNRKKVESEKPKSEIIIDLCSESVGSISCDQPIDPMDNSRQNELPMSNFKDYGSKLINIHNYIDSLKSSRIPGQAPGTGLPQDCFESPESVKNKKSGNKGVTSSRSKSKPDNEIAPLGDATITTRKTRLGKVKCVRVADFIVARKQPMYTYNGCPQYEIVSSDSESDIDDCVIVREENLEPSPCPSSTETESSKPKEEIKKRVTRKQTTVKNKSKKTVKVKASKVSKNNKCTKENVRIPKWILRNGNSPNTHKFLETSGQSSTAPKKLSSHKSKGELSTLAPRKEFLARSREARYQSRIGGRVTRYGSSGKPAK